MKLLLAVVLLLLFPAQAIAWSRDGHQLIAELAQRQLSPAAAAEVARLLDGEADPTLAGVAAWADEIRAEHRSHGHDLGRRSERWHYVNFPRGVDCDFDPATVCPDGDCVADAIAEQQAILADRTRPDAERARALKFVVHFVGDAHQPMHAGFGDDRGGNNYQIQLRARTARDGGEGTNLHRVWDYHLLASAGLDRGAYADALAARRGEIDTGQTLSLRDAARAWSVESCRLVADHALYPRTPGGRPLHVLGDDYLDRHRPLAEKRVLQAAARLAALLETALAPPR